MQKDSRIQGKTTEREKTVKMAAAGLFAAMIAVMTAYICHIPYGANGGYIHFGDALIYLAAVFLPRPYAPCGGGNWRRSGGSADSSYVDSGYCDYKND